MSSNHPHISKISMMHYAKLAGRSCLFFIAAYLYITQWRFIEGAPFDGNEFGNLFLALIWILFIGEMFLRFFPSNMERIAGKEFSKTRDFKTVRRPGNLLREKQ